MCLKIYPLLILISLTILRSQALAGQPENFCQALVDAYSGCEADLSFPKPHKQVNIGKKTLLCSDGKNLDFYARRENMDLASMLSVPYETGVTRVPEIRTSQDPGRLRDEDFFKAIYGSTESKVRENLVEVNFLGRKVLINKRQGAAKALESVSQELLHLIEHDSELKEYLAPFLNGTFKFNGFFWRKVAGTDHLSDHSFGVAIDIYNEKLKAPYYWLWEVDKGSSSKSDPPTREQDIGPYIPNKMVRVPWSLVKAFEKFGFIWGGKWNHFDAMHFEYRPEFFPGLKRDCENP